MEIKRKIDKIIDYMLYALLAGLPILIFTVLFSFFYVINKLLAISVMAVVGMITWRAYSTDIENILEKIEKRKRCD